MRRHEIAAHVWVHPRSRRTTVRIAEGGRKKLHQLYWCCAIKARPAAVGKPSYDRSHCRSRVVSHLLFSCQVSECLSTHSAACFSVVKPLITSVSPSGQRISTTQPSPGFFRATKMGRYSDILRIWAYGGPVQVGFPSGRLTSSNEGTWVHDSSAAPQTVQTALPVCGTKNFVSVRLYSAPQLHRTIVAILGICTRNRPFSSA